jgi:anti-sigma factor RsiW
VNDSPECRVGERLLHGDDRARLTPERISELRAHLALCAACHARHADDLALFEAFANVPLAVPPAWRPPRSTWRRAMPIAAAAAIFLVVARFPGPTPITPARAVPNPVPDPVVFEMVERRFRLGDATASPYVIRTKYHSVINTGR